MPALPKPAGDPREDWPSDEDEDPGEEIWPAEEAGETDDWQVFDDRDDSGAADEWPQVPVGTETDLAAFHAALDEDRDHRAEAETALFSEISDPRLQLRPGCRLLGLRERVELPELDIVVPAARCDPTCAISTLCATREGDLLRFHGRLIHVGDAWADSSRIRVKLSVAGCRIDLSLAISADPTAGDLVLGRDLMSHGFAVDPGLALPTPPSSKPPAPSKQGTP